MDYEGEDEHDYGVPLTCTHCMRGTSFPVALLKSEPDEVICQWCWRPFEADIDQVLDGIDFGERELRLFRNLALRGREP